MRYISIMILVVCVGAPGRGQSITNTLKNFSLVGNTYTFEVWSQASQSGMTANQALFQVKVTNNAFTVVGSTATLESKFSPLGSASLGLGTLAGVEYFQFSFGAYALPGIEISCAVGGERVATVRCKIADVTKSAGVSWKPSSSGWYWLTNLWEGNDNTPLPIQLSSFEAQPVAGVVRVTWSTISELDNYGFWVERGNSPSDLADAAGGFVPGHNTTLEPHTYSWTDTDPRSHYRLRQIDLNGNVHYSEIVATGLTGTAPMPAAREYRLDQNYPNPFNPSTTIRYGLPGRSHVSLTVYNTLGQQVRVLQNGEEDAGYHEVRFDGTNLPSGVYFYRLQSGGYAESRRLLLIR